MANTGPKIVRTADPRCLDPEDWCHPKNLAVIAGWVRAGWYGEKLANKMGISLNTLKKWRAGYAPINEALNAAEEEAVRHVEEALYKRALGYDVPEETVEVTELPDGGEIVKTKTGSRHIPGEVGAMTFFLKNRSQDRWNDNRHFSAEISLQVVEKQAQDLLDVMDAALMALNLTPDQRARLPILIQQAIDAKGLASGERDPEALKELEQYVDAVILEEIDDRDLI